LFEALDAHLSAGGKPPTEWVEGPDAPELDDERPDGFRECSCDLSRHTYPCLLAEPRDDRGFFTYDENNRRVTPEQCGSVRGGVRCWLTAGHSDLDHRGAAGERWRFERPEPLGGPVPGANGWHMPEVEA
jgi:hypothetical protein